MLKPLTFFGLYLLFSVPSNLFSQGLPQEMKLTPDRRQLLVGSETPGGLYDLSQIKRIDLYFSQPNYWQTLLNNYTSKTDLPATMVVDNVTYDSVGVRFKGQTSYSSSLVQNSQKKSFNISLDYVYSNQDINGYQTLNLNNCYDDPSFLRELFYLVNIRKHIPVAKDAFTKLYINNQNWGLYPNVQQLNKDFLKEWFMTNNGTNWRADRPPGSSGGGGGWGDGTAALNYRGPDTSSYKPYYTLKSTTKLQPWNDLVITCDKLNNTPSASLDSILSNYLDIDRALWFLASEIIFSDDDSYVYKGKMDYYVYWEIETGRSTPIEYDGNSVMKTSRVNWSPFYNATNANYPLLNKLLNEPKIRQRYAAHMRTLVNEYLDTSVAYPVINSLVSMIDTVVQNDPKKLYTYSAFQTEIPVLRNFIRDRKTNILANVEINQAGPAISGAAFFTNGTLYQQPTSTDPVDIRVSVQSATGIDQVLLCYSNSIVGKFNRIRMWDDGLHNDVMAGDGIFGAQIPPQPSGSWVRYYIEASANNSYKSISFLPAGAEHNVFVYFVGHDLASDTSAVINELMASNATTASDTMGEFDDWIELYNRGSQPIDLSGYTLTDDSLYITKWSIPQGTILQPNDYLIIWADEDGSQGPLHCNFKLSASGEQVFLFNAQQQLVDKVIFGQQQTDMGYARVPNGVGNFVIQQPTFGYNNDWATAVTEVHSESYISVSPNPAKEYLKVLTKGNSYEPINVFDILGNLINTYPVTGGQTQIKLGEYSPGVYFVRYGNSSVKFIVSK